MIGLGAACRTAASAGALLLLVMTTGGAQAQPAASSPEPISATARADMRQDHEILVMLKLSPDHYRPNASYGGDYGDQATNLGRRRLAQRIARRNGLDLVEGWPMPLLGLDCYVMRVPASATVDAKVVQVGRDPLVAWSQPMHVFAAQNGAPQAKGGGPQGHDPLFAVQPSARAWRLADLHRAATGKGVVVAVVDSRVQVNHPDLAGQFVANEDFVGDRSANAERHGTGVAGVIAAKSGNGVGISGVAPRARLMALRACWQTGGASAPTNCDSLSLAKALHYAIQHRADVINLSLTGPPDPLLRQLIQTALARRTSVVAAFNAGLPKGGFPASEPGVIAVANESLPSPPAGVYVAPGRDVPTTEPNGKWSLVNGSSFSAAHVSGLIALVREQRKATPQILLVAARPSGGVVDACATLRRVAKSCDVARSAVGPTTRSAP